MSHAVGARAPRPRPSHDAPMTRQGLPHHDTLRRVLIGELIRVTRERHGLTQARLARRIRVNRAYVSRVESGKASPTVDWAARALAAIGEEFVLDVQRSRFDDHDPHAHRMVGGLGRRPASRGLPCVDEDLGRPHANRVLARSAPSPVERPARTLSPSTTELRSRAEPARLGRPGDPRRPRRRPHRHEVAGRAADRPADIAAITSHEVRDVPPASDRRRRIEAMNRLN